MTIKQHTGTTSVVSVTNLWATHYFPALHSTDEALALPTEDSGCPSGFCAGWENITCLLQYDVTFACESW